MLAGIRILDLSQYLPGPLAAQFLSDLGAEVVKVEPPSGDPLRAMPSADDDGLSPFYKVVNAGKTVVRLDLKTEAGTAALRNLLARADVLLESYRPGALARLGFDRETLDILNPGLVHCALSGYGQTGPLAQAAGHDIDYIALSGLLAGTGPEGRPVMPAPPVADCAGAQQAALAIVAGLLRRGRTGQGAFLDVSMMESTLAWQAHALTLAARGRPPGRERDLLNGGAACYRVYRCADGRFVALGALEPVFWQRFCAAVGRADWAGRQSEPLPQTDLIAEVAALFETASQEHWSARLDGVDCCFQPVLEPAEVPAHPHIQARGLLRQTDGLVEVLAPILTDGQPPAARAPLRELSPEAAVAAWSADQSARR